MVSTASIVFFLIPDAILSNSEKRPSSSSSNKQSATEQPPSQWATGQDTITEKQASFIHSLADQTNEPIPNDIESNMSKGEASQKIEDLLGKKNQGAGNANSVSTTLHCHVLTLHIELRYLLGLEILILFRLLAGPSINL